MLLRFGIFFAVLVCEALSIPADMRGDDISQLGSAVFGSPSQESGMRVANWKEEDGVNPEELGEYAEGDILQGPRGRNGLVAETAKWPNGEVPYEINGRFNGQGRRMIEEAMETYHKYTCIRFRARTSDDADWLSIVSGGTGCWSSVGRMGGRQELNLQSPGCLTKIGTPIHEFMHALGFLHEQNRWERDDFVRINFQNIQANRETNFIKAAPNTTNGHGVDYDYNSVLHYSSNAFSKNGQPTIEAMDDPPSDNGFVDRVAVFFGWKPNKKNGHHNMGQREGFSEGDLIKIRRMYCSSREVRS